MKFLPAQSRSLIPLYLCCGGWAFGFGLECPLASRWLQDAGHSDQFIGFNTGSHFLGVVLMGALAPALMRRYGRTSILAGLLLSGICIAAFPWGAGPAGWFALRILTGGGGALAMIGLETLINMHSAPERRSRHFAFYACSVGLGFALGSSVGLHFFTFWPRLAFVIGGSVTLLAVPLVCLLPSFVELTGSATEAREFQTPLLSIGSAWAQGFLEAVMLGLLPLYLRTIGMSDGTTGNVLGGILVGVLICQVPIGWLADRIGRERVLIGCFAIVAAGLAFAPFADRDMGLPIWLFVIGVFSGAFYPLGLALLGERLPASEIPRANAWYLGINCFGSLVSPPLSGSVMDSFGPSSVFWTAETVIVGIILLWLASRFRKRFFGAPKFGRFRGRIGAS